MTKTLPLQPITDQTFCRKGYGTLIHRPPQTEGVAESRFALVMPPVESKGWMLGYLVCRNREIRVLHCHPQSPETFEPLRGVAVIAVAPPEDPEAIEAFLLDRPVCLAPGVWHAELTLSAESDIKIVENNDPSGRMPEHRLPFTLRVAAVAED